MAPQHGPKPYAILLCYTSDQPDNATRRPVSYFTDLFIDHPQGMAAYWREISYGNINLNGTRVFGWKKLSMSTAQLQMLGRGAKVSAIANEFANDADLKKRVDLSPFYGIIAIVDPDVDFGASGATVTLSDGTSFPKPCMIAAQQHDTGGYAHEMGHTLGLPHSFDDALVPIDPADDSRPGAYGDRWDAMSFANNIRFMNPPFGSGGPGMNVVQLGLLDWIAPSRLLAPTNETVTIAAVNTQGTAPVGVVLGTSTFEFRMNDGWDRGFRRPTVFRRTLAFNVDEHSMLHRRTPATFEFQPGDVWESGFAWDPYETYRRLEVVSFDTHARTATLNVQQRVGREPPVVGPGITFGGIEAGGAGILIINGHIIRVPPHSPVFDAISLIASLHTSELIQDTHLRASVRSSALQLLGRAISRMG